ncbi:MAG: hypothetical protein K2H20_01520, partial [Bacilli bacterium]|nr:hypothetical protein [Bacilli bacterium]
ITIAEKYDDASDILFYDLEGNYLGKLEKSEKLYYLTVFEEKFAFGREIIDGICTTDKYYMTDSGCDSITNFEVYALGTSKINPPESDGNSSGVTITNPETNSSKIMYVLIILIGSLT